MSKQTKVQCDVRGIQARIQQIGDRAVKHVSDAMRDYAEVMLRDAIANAPHDTGSIERALEIDYQRNGPNGRLAIKIWINPSEPYIDPNPNHNVSGKVVGDYAWLMESFLRPHGSGGWNARAGTKAKGSRAGGKFLERAVKEHRAALIQRAKNIIRRAASEK